MQEFRLVLFESLGRISKVEGLLGLKLIDARRGGRGGGGARLTVHAKKLLQIYSNAIEKIRPCAELLSVISVAERPSPDLVVMGSHDPLLEHLIGIARSKGLSDVEVQWTGSIGGLASIFLGEADVAGLHLYDPERNCFNITYLDRFMLSGDVVLISGYERELVFALRPGLEVDDLNEVFSGLASGELSVANRNKGSGTRLFLEYLLRQRSVDLKVVKGFETEYTTHFDVVRAVATGRADVCLTLKYAARLYNLRSLHVTWEQFDFAIPLRKLNKPAVEVFLKVLKQSASFVSKYPGYYPAKNMGEIKYR